MIGRSIGPYDVLAKLGEGGMGEVYRARDTKLDRDVAIEILPEAFASDPEPARFRREAKTLASLNHPNISAIYGIEDAAPAGPGQAALTALELVEGPTLAEYIAGGPVPLDEARLIASQMTDAMETAHDLGVIHRDLKPANIEVRPDGTVKVLDFGLAKALHLETGAADPCRPRPAAGSREAWCYTGREAVPFGPRLWALPLDALWQWRG